MLEPSRLPLFCSLKPHLLELLPGCDNVFYNFSEMALRASIERVSVEQMKNSVLEMLLIVIFYHS